MIKMIDRMKGYEDGANLTVMNVMYQRPRKDPDNPKAYLPDCIYVVYKDNDTGLKHVDISENPIYTYYIAKPEIQIPYNLEWIEIEKVNPVTCSYKDIKKSIAKETGNLQLYIENIKNKQFKMNDIFFAHPRVFGADMNILNYTRMQFAATYQNPVCPISIAYYDIENDIIDALTDEVHIGESPINVASIYFDANKTVYSFILRNDRNPLIQKFEDNIVSNYEAYKIMMNTFIRENIGSEEKTKKYKLNDLNLSVGFFDTELEFIISFFSVLKQLSPDLAVAYNASYDLPYLIERIKENGANPLPIISDAEFDEDHQFYYYFVDKEMYNDYEERKDYVVMSSKITWIDQMIVYASRRKGQNAISSFSLDNVANHECKVRKLEWKHITKRFRDFPYTDFESFWLYNINDTIVQACLEAQTEDLRYMFNNVIEMNTPYQKIFRQTNYLSTKGMEFYHDHEGVIMGNNLNRFGTKPDVKFPGAFVAKPILISDRNKVKCKGYAIMKFLNGNDFDYKALYPSLMREFNMSISTQIGMIEMSDPPFKPIDYLRLGAGGHYSEDLASYNFIQFAHRWLKLPDVEQMLLDLKYYFTHMRTPQYKINRGVEPTLPMDKSHKSVMGFVDKTKPLVINPPMPQWVKDKTDQIRKGIQLR